jgi:hypothetical protein
VSDISSQSIWSINSVSQGSKQLTRLRSYDVTDDSSVETRNAVGQNKPIGFVDKPGGCSISFEYYMERPKPEVDWRKLRDSKELFSLTQQIVGGERLQYPVCRVSKLSPSGDEEGEHMVTVEIVTLGDKRL